MSYRRLKVTICIVLLFSGELNAQNRLLLYKSGTSKQQIYKPGADITFLKKGQREFITDKILSLQDTVIRFSGYDIYLNEIQAIKPERQNLLVELGRKLPFAGAGFIVVDYFQGENPNSFNEISLIIGGAIIGTGVLLSKIFRRIYVIEERWKLIIIEGVNFEKVPQRS